MKINLIQLIFTYKKMPHIKFSPQTPKIIELALNIGEKVRDKHVLEEREKENKKIRKKLTNFAAHLWCDGHSTSISACEVWGVRAGVQVSKREFHTYIHLNQAKVEFYLV